MSYLNRFGSFEDNISKQLITKDYIKYDNLQDNMTGKELDINFYSSNSFYQYDPFKNNQNLDINLYYLNKGYELLNGTGKQNIKKKIKGLYYIILAKINRLFLANDNLERLKRKYYSEIYILSHIMNFINLRDKINNEKFLNFLETIELEILVNQVKINH